jgi:hypothetical protein
MAEYTADFELGVNGATISTSDAGSLTAWDFVLDTPVYDNTHVAHGSLAMRCNAAEYCRWTQTFPTEYYGRLYLYATAWPSGNLAITNMHENANRCRVFEIHTDGTVWNRDVGNTTQAGSVPIALNQWVRLEYHFIQSATVGLLETKLFNSAASLIASDTIGSTANRNTGSTVPLSMEHGVTDFNAWGSDIWIDDIVANATSYPGPFVDPAAVFNLAPVIYGRGAA